jgi:recombination protein RecA
MGDILEIGVEQGVVKKSGAFYSYGETKLGQGRENSKDFLIQHPEIAESIEGRLRSPVDEPTESAELELPDNGLSSSPNSVADFLANNGLEQGDSD